MDLDSPARTILHGEIIRKKKFLKSIYVEWYNRLSLNSNYSSSGRFIEIGSGAGFIKDILPRVSTSDIIKLPTSDYTFDCTSIPFANDILDGIFLIDVFHHVPDVANFLKEVERTLKPGGILAMSEPWNSAWGRFIYKNFHHEPFDVNGDWSIPEKGPLSGANGALPWIVFERDIELFHQKFPRLKLRKIEYHTPIRYLLSGGVSYKQFVPDFLYNAVSAFDKTFASKHFNMFAYITIEKV